jgi:hypothetical protein
VHSACTRTGLGVAVIGLGLLAHAGRARAQATDDLGFSAPSSVVQGSGARALGMGGAFLARPDDATAVSWNPAGLSYLARPEISVVGSYKRFDQSTVSATGESLYAEEFRGTNPDFLSGAWPVRLGSVSGSVQLGYQRVIGFAGTREWGKVPYEPALRPGWIEFSSDTTGGFDTLSAGIGLRVARPLRLGFVLNRWLNGFEERRERLGKRSSVQEVTFDLAGWNLSVGAIVHPTEALNLGFVYKWPFKGDVDLKRRRIDQDPPAVSSAAGTPTLDFPGAIGVGVSWRIVSPLTVSADFTRSTWSEGRIYDYFELGRPPSSPTVYPERLYPTLAEAPPQIDSDQWRFGTEYVLVGSRVSVPLRAGYYSDRQYFVDAQGRAPRYDGVTFGAGIALRGLLLDVAYVRQRGSYSDPDWLADRGRATITTHQIYSSLIYRFGRN